MATPTVAVTKLGAGGRVVIPAPFRKTLHLHPGDDVVMSLRDDGIHLATREGSLQWAQDQVCRLVPRRISLVKELIRDRRREAAKENRE